MHTCASTTKSSTSAAVPVNMKCRNLELTGPRISQNPDSLGSTPLNRKRLRHSSRDWSTPPVFFTKAELPIQANVPNSRPAHPRVSARTSPVPSLLVLLTALSGGVRVFLHTLDRKESCRFKQMSQILGQLIRVFQRGLHRCLRYWFS